MNTSPTWRPLSRLADLPQLAETLNPDRPPLQLNDRDRAQIVIARKLSAQLVAVAHDPTAEPVTVTLARCRDLGLEIAEHYVVPIEVFQVLADQAVGAIAAPRVSLGASDADRLFESIASRAVDLGATDIHLDGDANGATVHVRVHGEILPEPLRQLTRMQHETLARNLYVRADGVQSADWTSDHYLDASFTVGTQGREFRIRYSQRNSFPNSFDVNLRLLPVGIDAEPRPFVDLGFAPWQATALQEQIRQPNGMIVLVGEMNSGKSTTLASSLWWIKKSFPGRRIQTLENPVEFRIPGVRQSSVSERAAKGAGQKLWEAALGSLMRSDANVLMLGEIRDALSASYAQELTATGHLFLSTIHAPGPFMALQRLIKHGADPAVVFSRGFVRAVIHQRLLQRLCDNCSLPMASANLPLSLVAALRATAPEPAAESLARVRVRGPGCSTCNGRGIVGRTVAASLLTPDREISKLLLAGQWDAAHDAWHSGKAGVPHGSRWSSLVAHGLSKVFAGHVCPLDVDAHLEPLTKMLERLPSEMPSELALEQRR